MRPALSGTATGNGRDARQPHTKLAALAQPFAVYLDAAVVHFDQVLDDGESDSQAAVRAIHGPVALQVQVENMRQHLRVDTRALVAHDQRDFPLRTQQLDFDARAIRLNT